jgi:putative phosphoribosyl transferase
MRDEREWAGRELGEMLEQLRAENPVVVGVVRGGVPVAVAVAQAFDIPVDVLAARKILASGGDVLETLGAIAEDGSTVLLDGSRAGEPQVRDLCERAAERCKGLVELYRGGRSFPLVRGRTVILVDDAIATGATARAAIRLVRAAGAAKVVVAVPCALAPAAERVRDEADELVALEIATPREPTRRRYASFEQLSDEQVFASLRRLVEALHAA